MQEACAISNRIAPEHLEISAREPSRWEPLLQHAGAIFLGAFSSEALGDYCAGPNHVLPTAGTARFSSPLGVYDFVKRSSLIEVSARGAQVLGPIAVELALGEGLQAHARAAEMRLDASAKAPVTGFHLRTVTEANVDQLIQLDVAPQQQGLVATAAKSLAQASVLTPGRPLGIYDGDEAVGLLLLWDVRRDPDEPADQLYVWRLMIDAKHQRKGYGARTMRWVIDEARRLGVASVGLSHLTKPGHAGPFYEKLGFRYTGKVEHDEHAMELLLSEVEHG
jgi:histidinol dehydrogenase